MTRSSAQANTSEELLFRDGLGDRLLVRDTSGHPLHETLLLRAELSGVPSFEFALNQRLAQLDLFNHPSFVPVRHLTRVPGPLPRLSLVADYVGGVRLSEILGGAGASRKTLSIEAVLFLLREILDAVSALHRHGGELSHGALALERVVIVDGNIRITDHVLGSAIEQLRYSPERYWKDLRVAVPSTAGGARFDRRVDVAQIGMMALALFAGRPLGDAEHIGGLGDALKTLALAPPLRSWLLRALHMDPRRVFVNAGEGLQGLNEAIVEAGLRPKPAELKTLGVQAKRPLSIGVGAAKPQAMSPRPSAPQSRPISEPQTIYARGPRAGEMSTMGRRVRGLLKLGMMAILIAGTFTLAQYIPPPALFSRTGTLVVESKPAGVQLFVNGERQGVTPLTLKVKTGRHEVELRAASGQPRVFNVFVSSGARVSQYIEFPATARRQ